MTIAEQILIQLGGRKFVACTGCSNFHSSGDQDFIVMNIPRNGSKANRCEIRYNHDTDTYNMRFYRHRNASYNYNRYIKTGNGWTDAKDTELKTYEGVYCDMLREIFSDYTGMIIPMKITINGHTFG